MHIAGPVATPIDPVVGEIFFVAFLTAKCIQTPVSQLRAIGALALAVSDRNPSMVSGEKFSPAIIMNNENGMPYSTVYLHIIFTCWNPRK